MRRKDPGFTIEAIDEKGGRHTFHSRDIAVIRSRMDRITFQPDGGTYDVKPDSPGLNGVDIGYAPCEGLHRVEDFFINPTKVFWLETGGADDALYMEKGHLYFRHKLQPEDTKPLIEDARLSQVDRGVFVARAKATTWDGESLRVRNATIPVAQRYRAALKAKLIGWIKTDGGVWLNPAQIRVKSDLFTLQLDLGPTFESDGELSERAFDRVLDLPWYSISETVQINLDLVQQITGLGAGQQPRVDLGYGVILPVISRNVANLHDSLMAHRKGEDFQDPYDMRRLVAVPRARKT